MSKIVPPFVRNPFNYDVDAASAASSLRFMVPDPVTGELVPEVSLTVQSHADEADINTIVRRFGIGKPEFLPLPENFGEFAGEFNFMNAMNQVRAAQETFDALPADVRAEFDNSPAKMITRLADKHFRPRAIELGLIVEPVVPPKAEPMEVRVVNSENKT